MCEDRSDPFNFSAFFFSVLWIINDFFFLSRRPWCPVFPFVPTNGAWATSGEFVISATSKHFQKLSYLFPRLKRVSEWVEGGWAAGEWVTTDHAALCSCLMSSASFCHPSLAEACTWARDSQRGAGQIPGRVHEFPTRAGQEEGGVPEGAPRRAGPTQWVRAQLSLLSLYVSRSLFL